MPPKKAKAAVQEPPKVSKGMSAENKIRLYESYLEGNKTKREEEKNTLKFINGAIRTTTNQLLALAGKEDGASVQQRKSLEKENAKYVRQEREIKEKIDTHHSHENKVKRNIANNKKKLEEEGAKLQGAGEAAAGGGVLKSLSEVLEYDSDVEEETKRAVVASELDTTAEGPALSRGASGKSAIQVDTSTKPKLETKSVTVTPVDLPPEADAQAVLAGGSDLAPVPIRLSKEQKKQISAGMVSARHRGSAEAKKYFEENVKPNKGSFGEESFASLERMAVESLAKDANAGSFTGQTSSTMFDDNSQSQRRVNPPQQEVLSDNGSSVNPQVSNSNIIVPSNPSSEISKTDDGRVRNDLTGSPLATTQFNQISIGSDIDTTAEGSALSRGASGKKDDQDMNSLQFPAEDEVLLEEINKGNGFGKQLVKPRPTNQGFTYRPTSERSFIEEEFERAYGMSPAQRKIPVIPPAPYLGRVLHKSYTPQEMQQLTRDRDMLLKQQMKSDEYLKSSMQSQISQDLKADNEQNKTIGDRMRVGLDMYGDIPKADILVKSDNERLKSLHSYANHRWIESIQNSKRGNRSILKEMQNEEDKLRYGYTYMPAFIEPPPSQEELIMKNMTFINKHISQRFTPQTDNITELSNQGRCVGAEPPKLNNVGSYNYRHEGIYGTTDLGLSRTSPELLMPDFRLNTLMYPNIVYDMNNDRFKYL
jgi:hypothetical protein